MKNKIYEIGKIIGIIGKIITNKLAYPSASS